MSDGYGVGEEVGPVRLVTEVVVCHAMIGRRVTRAALERGGEVAESLTPVVVTGTVGPGPTTPVGSVRRQRHGHGRPQRRPLLYRTGRTTARTRSPSRRSKRRRKTPDLQVEE